MIDGAPEILSQPPNFAIGALVNWNFAGKPGCRQSVTFKSIPWSGKLPTSRRLSQLRPGRPYSHSS